MIDALVLRAGRTPGTGPQRIPVTPVTVIVGPNNAGKSRLLMELTQLCVQGDSNPNPRFVVDSIEYEKLSRQEAERRVDALRKEPIDRPTLPAEYAYIGRYNQLHQVHREALIQMVMDPTRSRNNDFHQAYLGNKLLNLDGGSRINLAGSQAMGDLSRHPETPFGQLLVDDAKRCAFRKIVYDAFGEYVVLDPTAGGNVRLRFSQVEPPASVDRSFSDEAIGFFRAAAPIELRSDGVKAFVGVVLQLIAGDPSILLIDEPEAFLHPALAFKLGVQIATLAEGKRVFAATHSPDFLMGCIVAGAPVTIIRVTYRNGQATARVLPNDELLCLMRNPLLRSTGVLAGLFYEGVVVTEGDSDRAFYQEINERLRLFNPNTTIPNCLFLNAQNKQTVHSLIRPLRTLGIPAAGIVDIDMLKEAGGNWKNFLEGGFVPEIDRQSLSQGRALVEQRFNQSGVNMKNGGLAQLSKTDREAALNIVERLSEYGLFIVSRGEVEAWLPGLGVSGPKERWLSRIFEKLGSDPSDAGYVKPKDDDVWQFLASVAAWIKDVNRKGIPD